MKDINVINFFEENNVIFSSNFNLGVTNLPSKLDFGKEINNIKIVFVENIFFQKRKSLIIRITN